MRKTKIEHHNLLNKYNNPNRKIIITTTKPIKPTEEICVTQSLHVLEGHLKSRAINNMKAENPIFAIKLTEPSSSSGFSFLQLTHSNMVRFGCCLTLKT
jgi:hypothetical protein